VTVVRKIKGFEKTRLEFILVCVISGFDIIQYSVDSAQISTAGGRYPEGGSLRYETSKRR
jgi:hypothetical protein